MSCHSVQHDTTCTHPSKAALQSMSIVFKQSRPGPHPVYGAVELMRCTTITECIVSLRCLKMGTQVEIGGARTLPVN